MKIAIDGSVAIRQLGGVSEYCYQLLAALGDLKPKHDVTVVTVGWNRRGLGELPSLPANFSHRPIQLPYRLLAFSWYVFGGPKLSSWLPPQDLFFAPHFLVPPGNWRRLVVGILDVLFLDHPEWFTPADARNFTRTVTTVAKRADHILTISEASKADIIRHGLAPADKITVTPLAAKYVAPDRKTEKWVGEKYSLPERYLLVLGTIEPRKNVMRILKAWQKVLASGVDIPLVFVGRRGWIGSEFDALLATCDPRLVRVLTNVTRTERDAILARATALIFPSLGEGFGLPVLEGMAAGVPVLTSDRSSLPEVAGDAALVVDPEDVQAISDGMRQLVVDTRLRENLIKAGGTQAKKFSWQQTARATLRVFEEVGA